MSDSSKNKASTARKSITKQSQAIKIRNLNLKQAMVGLMIVEGHELCRLRHCRPSCEDIRSGIQDAVRSLIISISAVDIPSIYDKQGAARVLDFVSHIIQPKSSEGVKKYGKGSVRIYQRNVAQIGRMFCSDISSIFKFNTDVGRTEGLNDKSISLLVSLEMQGKKCIRPIRTLCELCHSSTQISYPAYLKTGSAISIPVLCSMALSIGGAVRKGEPFALCDLMETFSNISNIWHGRLIKRTTNRAPNGSPRFLRHMDTSVLSKAIIWPHALRLCIMLLTTGNFPVANILQSKFTSISDIRRLRDELLIAGRMEFHEFNFPLKADVLLWTETLRVWCCVTGESETLRSSDQRTQSEELIIGEENASNVRLQTRKFRTAASELGRRLTELFSEFTNWAKQNNLYDPSVGQKQQLDFKSSTCGFISTRYSEVLWRRCFHFLRESCFTLGCCVDSALIMLENSYNLDPKISSSLFNFSPDAQVNIWMNNQFRILLMGCLSEDVSEICKEVYYSDILSTITSRMNENGEIILRKGKRSE